MKTCFEYDAYISFHGSTFASLLSIRNEYLVLTMNMLKLIHFSSNRCEGVFSLLLVTKLPRVLQRSGESSLINDISGGKL